MDRIKVFISCPSDVEEEKQIVRKTCASISKGLRRTMNVELKPIDWRADVIPLITGISTQAVIDRQLEDSNYDIYLGIMWKRFGDKQSDGLTPTESEFQNALKRMKKTGKPIIKFYFKCDEFYSRTSYEAEQFLGVQRFKDEIRNLDIGQTRTNEDFNYTQFAPIIFLRTY